jgi:hypothetical protein
MFQRKLCRENDYKNPVLRDVHSRACLIFMTVKLSSISQSEYLSEDCVLVDHKGVPSGFELHGLAPLLPCFLVRADVANVIF